MAKFTLLELHLDGSTFTANTPFGTDAELPEDAATDGDAADDGGSRRWLAALVGLLFLAVLAVLAKKKFGGDGAETLDDLE